MLSLKQLSQRIDPGWLVVAAIAIVALWPFIGRNSLPQETDAELHVFRLMELSYLVRRGELYPRWAPNFYHGYGYPIFNYYAPLAYYAGLPLTLLPAFDAVAGVKAVFVLGLALAAVGTYGFVRDNWGRPAGYVATAVYLYTPYVQFIDPHARGVLAESLALGLFPVALWRLDSLRRAGGRWNWLTAVFAVAAVILSHNLLGLLAFGVLAAWATWMIIGERLCCWLHCQVDALLLTRPLASGGNRSFTLFLPLVLLLALALSAFFWLPVFLERNAVELNTLIGQGDNFDFRTHFLTLQELLGPTRLLDWGATQPVFRFNLGVAQWGLAAVGAVALVRRWVKRPFHLTFFLLAASALVFLTLPASTIIWETAPLLPFFQFPWRLLGAAAPMLAVLAGAGAAAWVDKVGGERRRGWLTTALVAIPILLGLPLSQPAPWPEFGEVNHLRFSLIENEGRWLGTTSTSDFVPTTVDIIPRRNGQVVANFYEGKPLDRVNYATLPDGATITASEITPLHFRYHVLSPQDFLLRLFLFDFPGWQARVDGEPVTTELGRPEGFIVVPVPAGAHVVEVEFMATPARQLAWGITAVGLLLALVGAVVFRRRRAPAPASVSRLTGGDKVAAAAVVGITAVFLLVLQPLHLLHYQSTGTIAKAAEERVYADFGEQIALIGFDASTIIARPGEKVTLGLYWKAQEHLEINYQAFVHVLGPAGQLVAQSDKLHPGEFPTERWPQDKYVRDEHQLKLPSDLPPGDYAVVVGLWVQAEGWRLPLSQDGQQVGDSFTLFTLQVQG